VPVFVTIDLADLFAVTLSMAETPFVVSPAFEVCDIVTEHPEWARYYPTCALASFRVEPGKIRPTKQLPEFNANEDVRAFLRRFRDIAREHMHLGYIPTRERLFELYTLALLPLEWSDSHIPYFESSVPRLICKLLTSYGGETASLSAYNSLQALAPNQCVEYVTQLFDLHVPKVLPSEASPTKLAELYVSKLDTQYSFVLCQEQYESYLVPAQKAQVMSNNIKRGQQLRAAAGAAIPTVLAPTPVSDGFFPGTQPAHHGMFPPPVGSPFAPPPVYPSHVAPPVFHQYSPPVLPQPVFPQHEPMEVDAIMQLNESVKALTAATKRTGGGGGRAPSYRGDRAHSDGGRAVDMVCTKCNKPGHVARECRSHITCFTCGKQGHFADQCRSSGRGSGPGSGSGPSSGRGQWRTGPN
jgi:hypothetical protein